MTNNRENLFTKDFTLMIIGQIISLFGNVTLRFALSLFILEKTGSPLIFGTILAVSTIPMILFSPLGGVLADRVSKKWIMVILDAITATSIMILAFFMNSEGIVTIIAVAMIIFSIIQCFYQPSVQASVPALVGSEKLFAANGIVVQVGAVANLLGPVLGGILYDSMGINTIILVSAGCFLFSSIMELFIKIPFIKQAVKHSNIIKTIGSDLKSGFKVMLYENKTMLKGIFAIAIFSMLLGQFLVVGIPVIVKLYLGLPSIFNGFAEASLGLGTIAGALSVGFIAKKIKPHKTFFLLILTSISFVPIIFATTSNSSPYLSYALLIISIVITMFFSTMYVVYVQTLLQQVTPPHLMGKVTSLVTTIFACCIPIGQALYGILFDVFQDKIFIITGVGIVVGCAVSFVAKWAFNHFKHNKMEEVRDRIAEKASIT